MSTHVQALRVGIDPRPADTPVEVGGGDLPGIDLGLQRGVPAHLNLHITIVDCWVEGHVLTLEVVGPDGRRLIPGRRVVLGSGKVEDGSLSISTRLGFVPEKIGPHAVQLYLNRRLAGGMRFLVREPRSH